MRIKPVLVIMHARNVQPAQEAFAELDIPKLWLSGYTENELAGNEGEQSVFKWALNSSDFTHYIVVSDDALVRQHALTAICYYLAEGYEVITGYSQRSHTDMTVNVTSGPLRDSHPTARAYDFRQLREVISWPERLVPTWFTGMSCTGMSKEMWERFPFSCFTDLDDYGKPQDRGYASDFHLSRRLQDARVPIYAVREAFCYHWRNEWQHTNHPDDDPVLIGKMQQAVTLTGQEEKRPSMSTDFPGTPRGRGDTITVIA